MSSLPVDAHEEVGEETFIEAQLAALLNVRKADDNQYDDQDKADDNGYDDQDKRLADGRMPDQRLKDRQRIRVEWKHNGLQMDKGLTDP